MTGCTFRRYKQLETSPETIEQVLRPAVCEHRQTDLRMLNVRMYSYICESFCILLVTLWGLFICVSLHKFVYYILNHYGTLCTRIITEMLNYCLSTDTLYTYAITTDTFYICITTDNLCPFNLQTLLHIESKFTYISLLLQVLITHCRSRPKRGRCLHK